MKNIPNHFGTPPVNSSIATQTGQTSNFSAPTHVKTKFLISLYSNADFDKAVIWIRWEVLI